MTIDCKSIEKSELVRFQPTSMFNFTKISKTYNFIKNRLWNMFTFVFPRWINLINIFFLRKTNTFIKSKYSKNRQWSKSIVYFGLWFGVICAFTFTYYNYRFLFSFSYLWWLPIIFILTSTCIYFYKNINYLNFNFYKLWF